MCQIQYLKEEKEKEKEKKINDNEITFVKPTEK